jgi:putative MFS transporter
MYSIVGYTIFTGMSALAPNVGWYTAAQFMAKVFLNAEAAIVWTMVAEELPAKARGFGFGVLATASALGAGFGAIVFGVGLAPAGISWRWLYVIGLPPLFFVGWLRRSIPESTRFERARDGGHLAERWQKILEPAHRRWLILVVVTALLTELTVQAGTFTIDYMQTGRHLSTGTANLVLVMAGLPGIPILVIAGSLSDHYGRRLVGCGFAAVGTLGALGFFWLPGGVPVLLPCLAITLAGQFGAWPTLSGYASELFPTSLRGQAGSWANVARLIGDVLSFWFAALLLHATDQDFPITVTVLGIGPVIAVVLFAVAFPDTHGRELEDIAPD